MKSAVKTAAVLGLLVAALSQPAPSRSEVQAAQPREDAQLNRQERDRAVGVTDAVNAPAESPMSIVWVLLFMQVGDTRHQEVHVYATQAQCEEALGDVLSRGFASFEELGCERREQKMGLVRK